jgi:hypothetical protein
MKHADRGAYSDVEVQDLEVILLEGRLREANRQLVSREWSSEMRVWSAQGRAG